MIKVIEDYYIVVSTNPTNYTVFKGIGKVGSKGQNKDTLIGHVGGMENAIKLIHKDIIARRLSLADTSLSQAIHTIREATEQLNAAIKEAGIC